MKRKEMEQKLLNQFCDAIDLDDLLAFFREKQQEYLDSLKMKELKELYNSYNEDVSKLL